jgi:hypothetical protein
MQVEDWDYDLIFYDYLGNVKTRQDITSRARRASGKVSSNLVLKLRLFIRAASDRNVYRDGRR